MKFHDLNLNIKAVNSDGFFSGYGSVAGNLDSYRDEIQLGAFSKSIQAWQSRNKMPPVLWQHSPTEPIGIYTKLQEDDKGLYVEGQLLTDGVARAKEAHALLKAGAIDGLSIGYETVREEYDSEKKVNKLFEVNLWEISIVTFPANNQARVSSVKSILQKGEKPNLEEFKQFLWESGFSNHEAKMIMESGYQFFLADGDVEAQKAIEESIILLKGIK